MILKTNIAEVIKKLERIKEGILAGGIGGIGSGGTFSDAIAGGLNSGRAAMKRRIFNDGLDANGESLGKYIGHTTHLTDKKFTINEDDSEETVKLKKLLRMNIKNRGSNIKVPRGADTVAKLKARLRKSLADQAAAKQGYTEYEKKRIAHGKQINKKDLQFSGSLASSLETLQSQNKATLGISNPENAKIAGYQEQQIGNIRATGFAKGSAAPAPIFRLSKEEFELVRKEGNININEVLNNIIKNA